MAEQAEAAQRGNSDVAGVSMTARIPDFWVDQPRAWFLQAEAVLEPQKMADDQKYQIVIAKLGKEVIQQVTDLLFDPPLTQKYTALKERLLSIYEESENRRIQKLIGEMNLGDQKPSQLLRRMRDLARNKVADDTLVILWRNHLPAAVRAVLSVSDTKSLDTLAAMADQIAENMKPFHVSAVSPPHTIAPVNTDDFQAVMLAEIAKINTRLSGLERSRQQTRFTSRDRGRSASPQARARSASRGRRRRPTDPDWLCFYHFRYRNLATKCSKPCSWPSNLSI